MRDAVQARLLLVVGVNDPPRRLGDIGALQHHLFGFGVLLPARPRLDIHGTELPHCLSGSWMRIRKRNCCSSSLMENQYFSKMMPERTSMRSNSGTEWKNSWYCSSVQNPITRSTPARLYQLRSNRTIAPQAGICATYR